MYLILVFTKYITINLIFVKIKAGIVNGVIEKKILY